jgi:hypothetical protein
MARWRRRTGAGEPGRRDCRRGRPARPGEGRRWEVGDGADGWAPSVGERERGGREGHWWAVCGPKASVGPGKEYKRGVEVGRKLMGRRDWVGFVVFFSFSFFLFFFKSIFKPISNLFKFKSFTSFQIKIVTQISPTILKTFHKLFLTTFQTYFKFKPSFIF